MSENGSLEHQAVSAAEADAPAVPTYNDLFPSLPTASKPRTAQGAWSAAPSIKSHTISEHFTIPAEELNMKGGLGSSFGNRSSNLLDEIGAKTQTKITASMSKNKSLTIEIVGKKANVAAAKKDVLAKLQTQASIELPVPSEYFGLIVGQGGETRKRISDQFSVFIQIPKADSENKNVVIKGTTEGCRAAAAHIRQMVDERAKYARVPFQALKAYHPLIAGFDNINIKNIQQTTGANINVPPPSSDKDEIIVSGEKNAVAQAVRELEAIYAEKKATCGELTAQVKKSQHRFVIGPKGAHLRDITEKTGIVVEVPPTDSDSETIILRGNQQNLVHALSMVYEKANSIVVVPVKVPLWLHRHVIGKGGANIKEFEKNLPKIHLKFNSDNEEVEIEGPPADVQVARQQLLQLVAQLEKTLAFADVKVEKKLHKAVCGQYYSYIRKLKDETGAIIRVPDDDDSNDIFHIEGTPEAVAQAKAALIQRAEKIRNERSVDLIVAQKWHSHLIGPGGSRIRAITQKFPDISINFPDKSDSSEIVNIRGDKKSVEAVEKQIKQDLKSIEAENYELEVAVFKQFHRDIIGRNGSNIAQVRKDTNVRVVMPKQDDSSDVITLVGIKENCEKARDMILKKQDEVANIVREEMKIEPKHLPAVLGPKGRIIRSIQEELGVRISVAGKGKASQSSGVLTIVGPKDAVPAAKERILAISEEQALQGHTRDIKVPAQYHRFLIGRNGAAIQKLKEETGVSRVLFPPAKKTEGDEDADLVVVMGTEEATKKAEAAIKARVAELEKTTEETVQVDPKFYPDLLARRGQFLHQLADEFGGVAVRVPRADAEGNVSDQVSVKGSVKDVPLAVEKIKAFVDEIARRVTKTLDIDPSHVSFVIGPRGANVQRISADCNVNIKVPNRRSRSEKEEPSTEEAEAGEQQSDEATIKISGTPENCDRAIEQIKELLPITSSIDVDPRLHRFLIGSKGTGRLQIMNEHNVRLEFPKAEEDSSTIEIKGAPGDVEQAKAAIEAKIPECEDALARNFKMTVEIDPKWHQTLIGSRGANVNKLRTEHDVRIDFPRDKDGNVITLTGYEDKCQACADAIRAQVAELESYADLEVEIHPAVHRRIIGTRGANVRQLQDKYSVKINFPRERDSGLLHVVGPQEKAEECIEELKMLEEEYEEDIDDWEERQAYVKPSRSEERPAAKQPSEFRVAQAPWDMSASSFPSLGGGNASGSSAPRGVWGGRS